MVEPMEVETDEVGWSLDNEELPAGDIQVPAAAVQRLEVP